MRFKYNTDKLVDILETFANEHNIKSAEDIYQKDDVYTALDALVSDLYTKAATCNVMSREEYEERLKVKMACCHCDCEWTDSVGEYVCEYHNKDICKNSLEIPSYWDLDNVEVVD